jgi:hypothetical protein
MSQAKIDEALWFETLKAPQPAPVALEPLPEPRRGWFGFLRRR